ncbi:AIPR protein [Desulfobacula phenolica]|uniref:AIPR protein n=2 Tax=Desulfobacula phenolica TaxID=90732 RepID=A0A1H2J1T2_9BACT|nr:AIPR protein [Desulfobacula phenolica]
MNMSSNNSTEELLESINREIKDILKHSGDETSWEEQFAELMIEPLTEAGELDDGEICEYKRREIKINGYSYGNDIDSIDLFTVFCSRKSPSASISKKQIQAELNKTLNFLTKCMTEGYFNLISEASPVLDLALLLHERRNKLKEVRIFLFTDCRSKPLSFKELEKGDLKISFHVWDIQRFSQIISSGSKRETIEIDFRKEFETAIPCLEINDSSTDYKTILAVFPGEILADLYEKYNARLLERNVRAFLQARGKVNKGIRATLNTEPGMFLAYNNGITGTAESIVLEDLESGGRGITYLKDFQIVNGGQTTASLFHTRKKDKAELSSAFVQAKLCIINDEKKLNKVVPLVSRYSNSQNKVNDADFYSNDPFHVEVEELSRTIWAPAESGTNQLTHWFYERSRGQYNDEKAKLTPAQKRTFNRENPTRKRFSKTDLAKFENTWLQLPWIVSLGAQKNFRDFTVRLSERKGFKANKEYFQKLVAKAILFKEAEKIVSGQKYGGYRAQIVTYSLSWLSFFSYQRINLEKIWKNQGLSAELSEGIRKISETVHAHITNPPGGKNITEWCKKKDCWENMKELDIPIKLSDIATDQIESKGFRSSSPEKGIEGPDENDEKLITEVMKTPSEKWFEIAHWAKETDNLQAWQRSISFSIGRLMARGSKPSRKQAFQGNKIVDEVRKLGFPI